MRCWLEAAELGVRNDGPFPMPDVTWKILGDLRKEFGVGSAKRVVGREQTEKMAEHHKEQRNEIDYLATITALVIPALDASLAKGTKTQKSSLLIH